MSKLLTQAEIYKISKFYPHNYHISALIDHIDALTEQRDDDVKHLMAIFQECKRRAEKAEAEINRRDALADEPVAYAVYEIVNGKIVLRNVYPWSGADSLSKDKGLGEWWAGNNPLYAAPPAPVTEIIQALGMALSALISHGRDVPEVTKEYIADVLTRSRAAMLANKEQK